MSTPPNLDVENELALLRKVEDAGLLEAARAREAEKIFRKVVDLGVRMTMREILVQRSFVAAADLARLPAGEPPGEAASPGAASPSAPAPAAPSVAASARPGPEPMPGPEPGATSGDGGSSDGNGGPDGARIAALALKAGVLKAAEVGEILSAAPGAAAVVDRLQSERGLLPDFVRALVDFGDDGPLGEADLRLAARVIAGGGSSIRVQAAVAATARLRRDHEIPIDLADVLFKKDVVSPDALDDALDALEMPAGRLASYRPRRPETLPPEPRRAAEIASAAAAKLGVELDAGEILFLREAPAAPSVAAPAAPRAPAPRRRVGPSPARRQEQEARSKAGVYGIAAAAAVTAVILIFVGARLLGGPGAEPEPVARDLDRERRPPVIDGADAAARERVEFFFARAEELVRKNPYDIEGIRDAYEAIERKFAGTPDADRARELLDGVIRRREDAASRWVASQREYIQRLSRDGDFEEARSAVSKMPGDYLGTEAERMLPGLRDEIDRLEQEYRAELARLEAERERRRREEELAARAAERERERALTEGELLERRMGSVRLYVMEYAYGQAVEMLERFIDRARSETGKEAGVRRLAEIRAQAEVFGKLRALLDGGRPGDGAEVTFGSGMTLRVKGADEEGILAANDQVELKRPWRRVRSDDITAILGWAGSDWADPLAIASFAYDHGAAEWADVVLADVAASEPARVHAWLADRRREEMPEGGYVFLQEEWLPKAEADHIAAGEVLFQGEWYPRDVLVEDLRTARRARKRSVLEKKAREEAAAKARKLLEEHGIAEVDTLENNGDISRRVDIAIVSDGFTEEEATTVRNRANIVVRGILASDPFFNYQKYINIHLVRLVEDEPGINVLPDSPRQTKVGSTLQNNILTCNVGAAWKYGGFAPDADLVVVIANVSGGRATGGGGVITLNKDGGIGDVVIHELGHAYGGLDDEYVDPGIAPGRNYGPEQEAGHINTTRESDPKKVKWHYWNFPPPERGGPVGCYEGAYYHDKGYYRPSPECRMRSSSSDYCVVCKEHMERKFYEQIEPLEAAYPERREVFAWADEKLAFEIEGIAIIDPSDRKYGKFNNRWWIDGVRTNDDQSYQKIDRSGKEHSMNGLVIEARKLEPGTHEVLVQVELQNERIRRDHGHLSSTRAWVLHVSPHDRPRIKAPEAVRGRTRREVSFTARPADVPEESPFVLEARGLPVGAAFDPETGLFRWIPDRYQRGLFRVELALVHEGFEVTHEVDLRIRGGSRNSGPVMWHLVRQQGREGEELVFPIEAIDVDGDHLTFWSPALPTGAVLEQDTGIFRWTPGFLQADLYEIPIRVSDGVKEDEQVIQVHIADAPLHTSIEYRDFEIVLGLRSPNSGIRAWALEQMEKDRTLGMRWYVYELSREMRLRDREEARGAIRKLREYMGYQTGGWKFEPLLTFLTAVEPHCRQFVDEPDVLAFLDEIVEAAKQIPDLGKWEKERIGTVQLELEEIRRYNEERLRDS